MKTELTKEEREVIKIGLAQIPNDGLQKVLAQDDFCLSGLYNDTKAGTT